MSSAARGVQEAAFSGRVMTAVLMCAIFAAMTLVALGFPPGARLMPLTVGLPGTVLALISVFQEMRKAAAENAETGTAARRNERQMLLWLAAYFLGILGFGFLYAAPVLIFSFLRFARREALTASAIGAAGTWAVLYGLFELAFQIPLFDGLAIAGLAG